MRTHHGKRDHETWLFRSRLRSDSEEKQNKRLRRLEPTYRDSGCRQIYGNPVSRPSEHARLVLVGYPPRSFLNIPKEANGILESRVAVLQQYCVQQVSQRNKVCASHL